MKISKRLIIILVLLLFIFFSGCKEKKEQVSLTISAAISLTDVLEELKDIYENEHSIELTFILGSSGNLAQQIRQGAPVDIFISANHQWMDVLEEDQHIQANTRINITGNNLVLIGKTDTELSLDTFAEINADHIDKIAIGNPDSVPAGKYAEIVLRELSLWDTMAHKFVFAKDVRQVLTYVETGNTDIGFVYESDALQSNLVKILSVADQTLHEPITYPAAVITGTKQKEAAQSFIQFLERETAQSVLEKYGFKK